MSVTPDTSFGYARGAITRAHAQRITGAASGMLCTLCSSSLGNASRTALERSAHALGWGTDAVTYVQVDDLAAAAIDEGDGQRDTTSGRPHARSHPCPDETHGVAEDDIENAPSAGSYANSTDASSPSETLRRIVEALDPLIVIIAGSEARFLFAEAYHADMSKDGRQKVLGRHICAFDDLDQLMQTERGRQQAWAMLKTLPSPT